MKNVMKNVLNKNGFVFRPEYGDFVRTLSIEGNLNYMAHMLTNHINYYVCRKNLELQPIVVNSQSICVSFVVLTGIHHKKHVMFMAPSMQGLLFLSGWYFNYVFLDRFAFDYQLNPVTYKNPFHDNNNGILPNVYGKHYFNITYEFNTIRLNKKDKAEDLSVTIPFMTFRPIYNEFVKACVSQPDNSTKFNNIINLLNDALYNYHIELHTKVSAGNNVNVSYIYLLDPEKEEHKIFSGKLYSSLFFLYGWYFNYVFLNNRLEIVQ